MAELDNANPTILSAASLPTRQNKAPARSGPDSKYSDIIFAKPSYLSRPFCAQAPVWTRDAADSDGFEDEAIDEQEIYGT